MRMLSISIRLKKRPVTNLILPFIHGSKNGAMTISILSTEVRDEGLEESFLMI